MVVVSQFRKHKRTKRQVVEVQFIKLENGNYVNVDRIFSVYAMGSGSSWYIDAAGGEAGTITIGTLATPTFTSEEKAQQFIQQIFRGFDANTLADL